MTHQIIMNEIAVKRLHETLITSLLQANTIVYTSVVDEAFNFSKLF